MISGGIDPIFNTTLVHDTVVDTDTIAGNSNPELNAGLGTGVAIPADTANVLFNGEKYQWGEIKDAAKQAAAGANLDPNAVKEKLQQILTDKINSQIRTVQAKQRGLDDARAALQRGQAGVSQSAVDAAETALAQAQTALQTLLREGRTAAVAADVLHRAAEVLGDHSGRSEEGGSSGTMSTSVSQPLTGANGGGAGRSQVGEGSPGGSGAGSGAGLFNGVTPPTSAAYARALFMDGEISDGLGSLSKSRLEGQRLMMLFFYFARMAESGDLGAMYQFIKFINYIIAKDKARQNIQISTKLIELQDMSRKATEVLMSTPSDSNDTKVQNDFAKAMQQAKSQESTISTSQKLLADMLQEFAQVVETLTNSVKNMLDAWGRVLRNASAR